MKKLTLLGMGAAFALSFASCDKEQQPQPQSASTSHLHAVAKQTLRVYSNGNCKGSGGNCMDDVVVIGHTHEEISLVNDVNGGTTSTVITNFNNNHALYTGWFGTELVNGITAGTLTLSVTPNSSINTDFFIFRQDAEIVNVVPLVHD